MEIIARSPLRFAPAKAGYALAGLLPLMVAAQAQAVEFSFADDEITGSIDTTVSYGALWRVQGQDRSNNDVNSNDGNRNFGTGLVSQVFKITSDAEVRYGDYGAFVRGTAFYDTEIMDSRNDYYNAPGATNQPSQSYPRDNRFTSETRDKAGHNAEILDAYVYGYWDVFDMPLSARLGKQVFNWGEGLFYRGGVNTTNPVDAAKFRLPGSEVKEVLIPLEAFQFNLGLTDNLSMEAFYQWNWKETAVDPVGTFFSETDLFADGGNTAYNNYAGTSLAQDLSPAPGTQSVISTYQAFSAAAPAFTSTGLFAGGTNFVYQDGTTLKVADITSDLNAKDDGQFGVAFRYIAEELNSTEFGFYMVNYHAKEPAIYADLNGYAGVDVAALAGNASVQAACGGGGLNAACIGLAGGLASVDALGHVQAKREYAEDIRMYGLSFNTTVGDTSVFGELSYRPNLPVGISATNDLLGDLTAQAAKLVNTNPALAAPAFGGLNGTAMIAGQSITRTDSISNYTRVEAFNSSIGAIHNFGPVMSFDSLFGVAELASEHLRGDSLQYTANDGSTRYYAGRPNGAYRSNYGRDDQVNKNAYGYTLLVNGTWNDVYAGVNLSPFAVYKNDFEGNSHQTGNFIEGREAYTVGLRASYLNALEAEIQYTEFFGGGQNNSGRDRDNIGLNVKYSF